MVNFMMLNFDFVNGYHTTKSYTFNITDNLWLFNVNEMWINPLNNLQSPFYCADYFWNT